MGTEIKAFSAGVEKKLGYYVYRLIDPRNGHTFYVGKGSGDRVFTHMRDAVKATDEENDDSLKRAVIQDIFRHGLKPLHIIHRHGIKDKKTAHAIEAAVMDAFPNLTNEATGHGSRRYGPATAEQLNEKYAPDKIKIPSDEPIVIIKITKRALKKNDNDIYGTVRSSWKMSERRLRTINSTPHHVLAILDALCVGVYVVSPNGWNPSTRKPARFEFDGEPADGEALNRYIRKIFDSTSQWPVRISGF